MDDEVLELLEMGKHATPTAPLTIDQAHQIMRVHRACATDYCRRKDLAFKALVEAGRVVPDSSRHH
ncbi:hypothetical protein [Nocardia sp. NPDC052566]|uniref:hypothetical protein n=1 Tax=Nocardia sp. NPDC052566 TaxID=3364330 RepID=UPI0037C7891A